MAQDGAAETEVARRWNLNLHDFEPFTLPDERAIGKQARADAEASPVAPITGRGLPCRYPISFFYKFPKQSDRQSSLEVGKGVFVRLKSTTDSLPLDIDRGDLAVHD